jgi:peptide/nickel transport system permease protein
MDFLLRPKALFGLVIVGLVLFSAAFSDLLSPYDPLHQSLRERHQPPAITLAEGSHLLGTDHVGRDVLSRIIYGARISVLVGIGAVAVSAAMGMLIGLVAGYYGGIAGAILMRIADIKLAMPMILFAIAWIAFFGGGLVSVIIIIGVWGWVPYARYARSIVLTLREALFVEASVALGAGSGSILVRHVAPNLVGPLIVIGTLQVARFIIAEASISFLGFGVQPPTPAWGSMVSEGLDYIFSAWWLITLPGLALALVALAVNITGDWLRDTLDPRIMT